MRFFLLLIGTASLYAGWSLSSPKPPPQANPNDLVVLGYNDLGMHCMNQDFSELCILPPFNTLRAQVIRRGEDPQILKTNTVVTYSIPGNTTSLKKTNFWMFAPALFGVKLPPNMGLAGYGLTGTMRIQPEGDWSAVGIPVTPLTDSMKLDPYQLATIRAASGNKTGSTKAVIPVSWGIN